MTHHGDPRSDGGASEYPPTPAAELGTATGDSRAAATRAGMAVRARREELGLSVHTVTQGVVAPNDYARFEEGGQWPSAEVLAALEQRLRWPVGTITGLGGGDGMPEEEMTDLLSPTVQVELAMDAAAIEVRVLRARIARLPAPSDRRFTREVSEVLTQLRRLEHLAMAAARQAPGRVEVLAALATVRQAQAAALRRAVSSPWVTLGQRMASVRHRSGVSLAELAAAAGVAVADLAAVEREDPRPAALLDAVRRTVSVLEDALGPAD